MEKLTFFLIALLYLVPCSLVPTILLGYVHTELTPIWYGSPKSDGEDGIEYGEDVLIKNTDV